MIAARHVLRKWWLSHIWPKDFSWLVPIESSSVPGPPECPALDEKFQSCQTVDNISLARRVGPPALLYSTGIDSSITALVARVSCIPTVAIPHVRENISSPQKHRWFPWCQRWIGPLPNTRVG
ncbi:hypothetical protein AFLA70_28g003951 [Aspergillus flavus AF70]|nr:hypothetical protein AFLA70_28g003951 [Aspergillus flavus AF70]